MALVCCLHYATITKHSILNLIDRHQFPWLTMSISQIQDGFIPALLNLLDTDPDEDVRFKSLSAISCLIRDYKPGQDEFLRLNGCSSILRNIQMSKIRLRVKVLNNIINSISVFKSLVTNKL